MKKYLKKLGLALVCFPVALVSVVFLAIGVVFKSLSYALTKDFEKAVAEIDITKEL